MATETRRRTDKKTAGDGLVPSVGASREIGSVANPAGFRDRLYSRNGHKPAWNAHGRRL